MPGIPGGAIASDGAVASVDSPFPQPEMNAATRISAIAITKGPIGPISLLNEIPPEGMNRTYRTDAIRRPKSIINSQRS